MQVLDDVWLLGAVKQGHGIGVAGLGPHAGVRRVDGHSGHVAEKVHHEGHGCDLDKDLRKQKPTPLEDQTTMKAWSVALSAAGLRFQQNSPQSEALRSLRTKANNLTDFKTD